MLKEGNKNIERIHCNKCLRETKHLVLYKHSRTDTSLVEYKGKVIGEEVWEITWTMLECRGCESVTMRRHVADEGPGIVEYYPPSVSRRMPQWQDSLPREMKALFVEIYAALHVGSRRLAMMGARSVIEMFMLDKIGDIGSFGQKLEQLVQDGYLGKKQKEILSTALDIGNATIHRGYNPPAKTVNHVIDVIEHLIQFYIFDTVDKTIKPTIPSRPPKPKKT